MEPFDQTSNPVSEPRKSTFGDTAVWLRGLYMLLLVFAFGIAQTLLCVTAIVQFLWLLFAGEANGQLAKFGGSLSRWFSDASRFLTSASDVKPFPWSPWPSVE
ncbi:MAG: DUF4389 domain-containing protein [Hyphomicrobium sp.]|jgi:hypothetical protein